MFWTCFEVIFSKKKKIWPVFHGGSRLLNLEKNRKKLNIPNSEFALNRSQKCPKVFWGDFIEKFLCPVLHGGSSIRKFSKIFFSKFQKNRKSFPKVSKRVLNVFWGEFFEKNFNQCSMEARGFYILKKTEKNSIFRICPKSFPKVSKNVLGWFFRNNFMPSAPWRVEFLKLFKKKCFQNSKNAQNRSQKTPNLFRTCFGANFSKYFMPSVPWRVEFSKTFEKNQKFSKFQKCRKSFPKNSKPVLNVFRGKFFEIFYAQFSMEGRVFENFQKNQKIFKIPKMPKIVPKCIQTCFDKFWGKFLEKFFPSFPWRVESSKTFKKSQKFFQNSKNAQKRSQKYTNIFWTCFGATFWKKFRRSVPWRVESSKTFKKNQKIFKIPKMPKSVPKSIQTCFERVLEQLFGKNWGAVFHGGSSLRKFLKKKTKNFQSSRKAENRYQRCPNVFWTCFGANFSKKNLPSVPWRLETSKS